MNPKSFDDYDLFVDTTLASWAPAQRTALAASMAERWLPQYEAFSKVEKWGDGPGLRHALNVVWEHLEGNKQPVELASVAELRQLVRDNTPHMDDFDAPAALAACIMVSEALQSCTTNNNAAMAAQAIISGFEAVDPEWESEEIDDAKRWRRAGMQREIKKQLNLIEKIGELTRFDAETIRSLRTALNGKALIGEIPSPDKAKSGAPLKDASGRTLISNQTAFDQYRRMMEADLRNSDDWWQKEYSPGSTEWAMMIFGAWSSRYSRRRQTLDGTYGPLADGVAQQALLLRQRTLDGRQTASLDWDPELMDILKITVQNPYGCFEVKSLEEPHSYGRSLRALWTEAQSLGLSGVEAWNHILSWARHRPAAWQVADSQKKQRSKQSASPLADYLSRDIVWDPTGDPEQPWATNLDGTLPRIRLNDFPDDFMYTLLVNGNPIGDFNDWPENWER